MLMNLPAQCRVTIPGTAMDDANPLVFAPGCGMRFGIAGTSAAHVEAILRQLPAAPASAYVPFNGGLISNLRVGENLILPAVYHSHASPEKFEAKIVEILAEFGYDKSADVRLLAKLPAGLSVFERRLVSFIRAAILEPAVIVYDSLWADLPAHQFTQVVGFDAAFRRHCPLAVSIYLQSGSSSFPFEAAFDQTFVLQDLAR
jgi:hypothetical protein